MEKSLNIIRKIYYIIINIIFHQLLQFVIDNRFYNEAINVLVKTQ